MSKLIYSLSDSIGDASYKILQIALSQFPDQKWQIEQYTFLESVEDILALIEKAQQNGAFVVFSFVKASLRDAFNYHAQQAGLAYVDLTGYLFDQLSRYFNQSPFEQPGLVQILDQSYFERVEAIEFAVKYDDGKDPRGILKADIVLVGISRTSKTPLSMYLAGLSYKVANVPIYPEAPIPKELFQISNKRIVGLTHRSQDLAVIRRERMKQMGFGEITGYSDINRIEEEKIYARKVFQQLGCPVLDVSDSAVEEIASQIIKLRQNQGE